MTFPAVISSKMACFRPGDFAEVGNRPLDVLIMLLRQILMAVVIDEVSKFG
jgi:hypothetical protein